MGSKELGVNFNASVLLRDSIPGEKSVVRLGVREGFLSRARTPGGNPVECPNFCEVSSL